MPFITDSEHLDSEPIPANLRVGAFLHAASALRFLAEAGRSDKSLTFTSFSFAALGPLVIEADFVEEALMEEVPVIVGDDGAFPGAGKDEASALSNR